MSRFRADYEYSLKHNRQIGMILGPVMIRNASMQADMKEATDLVLETTARRIACRIRRRTPGSYDRFGDQYTIRSLNRSGAKAELEKILAGFGDLLFYGWADTETARIKEWHVIDLGVFRQCHETLSYAEIVNRDQMSAFRAYFISELPPGGVIASGVGCQIHDDSLHIL